MNSNEPEALLRREISANRTCERPIDRIFNDESPDEAVQTLKRLANDIETETCPPLAALGYYRGMRWALDLSDVQWLGLETPALDTKHLRRDCAEQYRRYRELFELEIAIARRQKAVSMALAQNWSGLESCVRETAAAWRCRLMLRAAELMFRFGVPGALDLCDSAVVGMVRLVYLRPAA